MSISIGNTPAPASVGDLSYAARSGGINVDAQKRLNGQLADYLRGSPNLNISPYDEPQYAADDQGKVYLFQRGTAEGKDVVVILQNSVEASGNNFSASASAMTIGLDKLDAYLAKYPAIQPAPKL
jgi:hypothetical protein